jgi:hypothetical protein
MEEWPDMPVKRIEQLINDLNGGVVQLKPEESLGMLRVVETSLGHLRSTIERLSEILDTSEYEKALLVWLELKKTLLKIHPIDRTLPPHGAQVSAAIEDALKILVEQIRSDPTKVVVISGVPGSGKSEFLKKLLQRLPANFKDWNLQSYASDEILLDSGPVVNFDQPKTIFLVEGFNLQSIMEKLSENSKKTLMVGVYAPPAIVLDRLKHRPRVDRNERIGRYSEEYDSWYFGEDFSRYDLIVVNSVISVEELAQRQGPSAMKTMLPPAHSSPRTPLEFQIAA